MLTDAQSRLISEIRLASAGFIFINLPCYELLTTFENLENTLTRVLIGEVNDYTACVVLIDLSRVT